DAIRTLSTNQPVRFVLLSPIRHEDLGSPLPNPKAHNRELALYDEALREIARERNCEFVSLFELASGGTSGAAGQSLTDNGIHPSAFGYVRVAEAVGERLGWEPSDWRLKIGAEGRVLECKGASVFAPRQR